jgi:gamma-glutamyltranspeptidase/glutathione hydrolase
MLNLLEGYDLGEMKRRDPKVTHLLTETMKIGFYNRAKYLGDTDFVKVDLPKLTSKDFIKPFRDKINLTHAMSSKELGADIITRGEGSETTHFSVVDAQGNAVSNTFTLEQGYGARVVAPGTGFLLNNEMHDFNMNPGVTDTKGLIGTQPNLIEPGKRMLSSMSPMIILKDGKPFLVTGSPGGRTIINTVLQIIVNVVDFKMDIQAAVDEPRIHHQWMPDTLTIERGLTDIQPALQALGHDVRPGGTQGDAQSILIKDGKKFPGVDHRTRGGAAGY